MSETITTLPTYQKFEGYEERIDPMVPEVDDETGWKYVWRDIGMVKNAKQENTRRMKVYLDPQPHVVLDQNVPLRGWYKAKFEKKSVRDRPCYTEAMLTQPYGGTCPIACHFCYINHGVRGYRGQKLTVVDPNYPIKIEKQVQRMKWGTSFYISSFTEAFQDLESYYHNTQRTTNIALRYNLPIFFLSRRVYPGWAIDALRQNKFSYAQFSINTPDEKDFFKLSPGAAKLSDLFECIKELKRNNIYVSIQCNPVIAGVTSNEQIIELIYKLKQVGADHIIFKFVELVNAFANKMSDKIHKIFPDRGQKFKELFTETIGSVRTIQESYRLNSLNLFKQETIKAGITMSVCYEYEYEKNEFGIIMNKTGVSVGLKYTTSQQCHGLRVPMHYKTKEGIFKPFPYCSDGGCLYCSDIHNGKVPCGSDTLALAKALQPSNFLKQEFNMPDAIQTLKHISHKEEIQRTAMKLPSYTSIDQEQRRNPVLQIPIDPVT